MADNKTFQSATPATLPANTVAATKEVSFSGNTTDVQLIEIVAVTGSEGSRTLNEISDASGLKTQGAGTAGTPAGGVVSVQGVASGTALPVSAASLPLPSGASTAANQSTANTALAAIQTAVEILDNFISGSKGLVTEDNSASILTAVQTIDNFISGSRGLVTEDNSAAMLTALQVIDNFISGSRGLVTEDNSAAALTALQLIDDIIVTLGTTTYSEATTKGAVIAAVRRDADTTLVDTTNEIGPLQMNAAGQLKVEVFDGGDSHTVDNNGTFVTQIDGTALTRLTDIETNTDSGAVVGNGAAATAQRVTLASDSTGIVALTTSSATIGKLAANSGVDIGDVDITSIAAGDNNIGNVDIVTMPNVTLAASTNNIGDVDILSIAAGDNNIGNVDIVTLPALAAGTAEIGSLLPPDTDVTAHTNYARKYYTSTGAATDGIVWSPAAGKRWHVVSLYFNVSAAATVTFEDDKAGGDDPVLKGEFAANSGMTINFGEQYPMASGEDAADLLVTTSAGNIYVTVTGYEI